MKFGTVAYDGRHWHVRCEPHVRGRIRRVFPRMSQAAAEVVMLSDTPENARELLWFLQRYPMECPDAMRLAARAHEHEEQERRLAELFRETVAPLAVELAIPAREYQTFAAHMLMVRHGLLLADDVGLGKTFTSAIPMAMPENLPTIVVCFPHLARQWERELTRFLPGRRIHRIRSGKVYDLVRKKHQRVLFDEPPEIIIISYHMLRTWAETLSPVVQYAVFDEAQQLRHAGTLISQACRHIARAARLRIGLTATPIYNYGSEFFNVVDTLLPDSLGTAMEFSREWLTAAPGGHEKLKDSVEFGTYLRREGIMLRRTRKDVGRELPPIQKCLHTIECDESVLEKLEGDAIALARVILTSSARGARFEASGQFDMIMRQATGISKAPYVGEFCRLLLENGEPKIVVYAWHRSVYEILVERFEHKPNAEVFKTVMYTGSESGAEKQKSIDDFIQGDARVLLMSLRSGAGVDGLQKVCRTCVAAELDWSPGVLEQCIGRIARDGQTDSVMAYILLAESGTDPIMAEVLGLKREQIEGVRNPDSALAEVIETGEHHLRRIARELLERRGEIVPEEPTVTEINPAP